MSRKSTTRVPELGLVHTRPGGKKRRNMEEVRVGKGRCVSSFDGGCGMFR